MGTLTAPPHLVNQSDPYSGLMPDYDPIPKAGRHVANAREKQKIAREEEARRIQAIEEAALAGEMTLAEAKAVLKLATANPDTAVVAVNALSKLNGWMDQAAGELGSLKGILARRRDAMKPLPEPIPYVPLPYEAEIAALDQADSTKGQ